MFNSVSRSGSASRPAPGKLLGTIVFMLAVVGIVGLGGWLLQTLVSTILHIDLLAPMAPTAPTAPMVADTDKRILVVPSQRPTNFKCTSCGVVVSMRLVTAADDAAVRNMMGNAVVGGMIGNLLGGARGQELFGWLGAIAAIRNGGVLQPSIRYETTVRFDNGSSRVFVSMMRPQWRDGDRIRVAEGAIQAFSPEDAKLKAEVTLSRLLPVAPVWI